MDTKVIRWLIIGMVAGCASTARCPEWVEVIPMWTYQATVIRVVDGDTLDLEIDLGFRVFSRQRVRLQGVDTPETFGVRRGSDEHRRGVAARDFVSQWFRDHAEWDTTYTPSRAHVTIRSHDGGRPRAGKYGRWLVEIFPHGESVETPPDQLPPSMSLNRALIDAGHAVPYDGGRRR